MTRFLASLAILALFGAHGPAAAAPDRKARYVDLELVIATDVSRSIDEDEALLQRKGTAQAFRDTEVIRAIRSGFLRRIAVAYIDYSSTPYNRVVVDWHIVHDGRSAEAFAARLILAPMTNGWRTSISDGIEHAAHLIENNDIEGTRRVIDVSGDGPNNYSDYVDRVRDEVTAKRITINGLPIKNKADEFYSRYYLPDLDDYYRGCVIGGPGAFLVIANDFKDFARAMKRKLILEIAGITPPVRPAGAAPPRIIRVSSHRGKPRPGHGGYVYPGGCDIGERMRGMPWMGDDS